MYTGLLEFQQDEKQSKKNIRARIKLLREITSHTHFGIKTFDGPRHCNTKDKIVHHYNLLNYGQQSWLPRLKVKDYKEHFKADQTFYFCGNWRTTDRYTLAMIDIDCHKHGTLEGAKAFAEYLKGRYFPKLYYEVSTNGNGIHAYIIVKKLGYGAEFINNALAHLRKVISQDARDFNIELVEVKGSCPVFTWEDQRNDLIDVKAGTLAKIPRGDFTHTDRIDVLDILRLEVAAPSPDVIRINIPSVKTAARPSGSAGEKAIDEDELDRLHTVYVPLAEKLMACAELQTSNRTKVTQDDFAIFLMLLKFFTNNPNDDDSLPTKRFQGLWDAMYEAGDINRSFQPTRFKAIRDYLSDLGFIDWFDNEYRIGQGNKKGQACKWQATAELMQMMEVKDKRTSFVVTNNSPPEDKRTPFVVTKEFELVRPVLIINFTDLLATRAYDEYLIQAG